MSELRLEDPTDAHAESLFKDVRQVDRHEWVAGTMGRPLPALKQGLSIPGYRKAVVLGDRCLCIWGVHDLPGNLGIGQAWAIATNEMLRHVIAVHRFQQEALAEIDERWPTQMAWSLADNTVHHEWMRRLGFRFLQEERLGLGIPFHLYVRQRE